MAGSAGAGTADRYSDLDLIVYYDDVPYADLIQVWGEAPEIPAIEPDAGDYGLMLTVTVEDIECQIAAFRIHRAEESIRRLLSGEDPGSAHLQKVADGLFRGHVLGDDALAPGWRRRLNVFPDALANSMAAHHLAAITPYWRFQEYISHRGAPTMWRAPSTSSCVSQSRASRWEMYSWNLTSDKATAARELKALVKETVEVVKETVEAVERQLPQVDTEGIHPHAPGLSRFDTVGCDDTTFFHRHSQTLIGGLRTSPEFSRGRLKKGA